jgi:phosphatidylglycerol:prolipoprotein diacylglycerol transferase
MFSWLHNFYPQPNLLTLGPITIHWYGLCIVLGIIGALALTLFFAQRFSINQEKIWDLSFYLVLFGIIGARIYEIFLEFPYYSTHPEQMIKIWQGGLAIHGAIIAGLITVFFFVKKNHLDFWQLSAIVTPGLALGQAIGRWGNWFNQELFGLPTNLPWGIPIALENRPAGFLEYNFFQPTFLYESLGSLLIAGFLFWRLNRQGTILKRRSAIRITTAYLIFYSLLRFSLEFIRLDDTPLVLGWRWPQIISLIIIALAVILYLSTFKKVSRN